MMTSAPRQDCPTEVIENKPICLCFPCCIRDLTCLDLALLPPRISHVLDRHKFPGERPPYKSNFYCHPGRAGGTPMLLVLTLKYDDEFRRLGFVGHKTGQMRIAPVGNVYSVSINAVRSSSTCE